MKDGEWGLDHLSSCDVKVCPALGQATWLGLSTPRGEVEAWDVGPLITLGA